MRSLMVLLCLIPVRLFTQTTAGAGQQVESHAAQAREFLKNKRPDLAIAEYRAALGIDPDNADAHANLGVLVFFSGDSTQAEPELRTALRLRPDLWKIEALLGVCEKRLGQNPAAREHLEHALPHIEEANLRVQAGMELTEILYAAGDLDRAAATVADLRRLRPDDPDVLYTAHRIYTDLADECMLSVALAAPDSARMRQLKANELGRRGKTIEALVQYREAVKLDPHLPGIHFQFAEMLRASSLPSDRAQAEKEYLVALADNPLDTKAESSLGEIALEHADLKTALARYSHAVTMQPSDGQANLGLARVLTANGQANQAEPYLIRAAQAEPFNPLAHMRLAALYRRSGRSADAQRELAKFLNLKALKDRLRDVYLDNHAAASEQPLAPAPSDAPK